MRPFTTHKPPCSIAASTAKVIKGTKKKKIFMAPFYGWDYTSSRLEQLLGGSLLFPTKFPKIPSTHFIDLGWWKD